jgi:hypothetical protein
MAASSLTPSCGGSVGGRFALAVRLRLDRCDAAELLLGRRRHQFDADRYLEARGGARHEREPSFDLEAGFE